MNASEKLTESKSAKPKPNIPRKAYTMDEAGASIGLSYVSIWRLVKAGKIRTFKALSKQLIPLSELDRYIAEQLEANQ